MRAEADVTRVYVHQVVLLWQTANQEKQTSLFVTFLAAEQRGSESVDESNESIMSAL